MPRFLPEPPHRHGTAATTAVVLVNLGTPDAPTAPALRRYLKQFLSDPRVVEIPKPLWWLILNGIILNIRPKKSAAKYATVWMPEGSPLRVHTERQAKLLKGLLGQRGHHLTVTWAMRYGSPSIPDTLAHLKAEGANRILIIPMYPQYAASTTAMVHIASEEEAVASASAPDATAALVALEKHLSDLALARAWKLMGAAKPPAPSHLSAVPVAREHRRGEGTVDPARSARIIDGLADRVLALNGSPDRERLTTELALELRDSAADARAEAARRVPGAK